MQSFSIITFTEKCRFAAKNVLQHKCNERQIREIHEREYMKYVTNLRQQSFHSNMSHLSTEHIKEIERARLRHVFNKHNQYERVQRENNLLSERLFQTNKRTMIDNQNSDYQQNLEIFNSKYSQQRLNEYKRIDNENQVLAKRIRSAHGQLINKQQCNQDWQRHISMMKKNCDYPENIDRFVSNTNQHQRGCKWIQRHNTTRHPSPLSENPLAVLLGLSE